MKKIVMAGALLTLAGCVQVDTYEAVVKAPALQGWKGSGNRRDRRAQW